MILLALTVLAVLLLGLDWAQTVHIARNPLVWREVGWARHFIGVHPSVYGATVYFAWWIVVVVAVVLLAPRWAAWLLVLVVIAVQVFTVVGNYRKGIALL